MKTLTRKAIVLASAIAVAGAFAVLAESPITIQPITPAAGSTSIDVTYTLPTMADADQVTILAYQVTTANPTPVAENIVFIDQVAKSETDGSINFTLRDGFGAGDYKVLMGGTGITEAGSQDFVVPTTGPTGYTVSGTISPAFDYEQDDLVSLINYSAVLKTDAASTEVLYTATVDDTTGAYTFTEIPTGSYVMALARPGYMSRYFTVDVVDDSVIVNNKSIQVGDVDGDGYYIDTSDTDALAGATYNGSLDIWSSDPYPIACDFNADGFVDTSDTDALAGATYNGSLDIWSTYTDSDDVTP